MKKNLIIVLLVSSISTISAQEKTHSNYLKTIEFIKKKYNIKSDYVEIKNCEIIHHKYRYDGYRDIGSTISKVKLKYLNPNSVDIFGDSSGFTIETTENIEKVNKKYSDFETPFKYYKSDILIFTGKHIDSDNIRRLAKAFKWLIEYCGGKDEMF